MKLQHARLMYDSARTGAHIGLRSGLGVDRMLLFGAPGMMLDLVIHAGSDPCRFVYGQIVSDRDERPLPGVRIGFVDQGEPVETDEFGEFSLALTDGHPQPTLHVLQDDAVTAFEIPSTDAEGGI